MKISIDQLRSLPDYAQVTKWDVQFITLPAVGPLANFDQDALNMRCESIEIPKATIQKFEVSIRGHKTFQPGLIDYGNSMTLTFTETVDNTLLKFIKAWRELIWSSRQGKSLPKSQIEATLLLTMTDNEDNIRAKYTVYGCFYEGDDFGTLDGSTSDAIKPTLTLSFDYYIDTPLK